MSRLSLLPRVPCMEIVLFAAGICLTACLVHPLASLNPDPPEHLEFLLDSADPDDPDDDPDALIAAVFSPSFPSSR